jgi:hypothetical protein
MVVYAWIYPLYLMYFVSPLQKLARVYSLSISRNQLRFLLHNLYENICSAPHHPDRKSRKASCTVQDSSRRSLPSMFYHRVGRNHHGARTVAPGDSVEPLCSWREKQVRELTRQGRSGGDLRQRLSACEPRIDLYKTEDAYQFSLIRSEDGSRRSTTHNLDKPTQHCCDLP